MRPIATPVTNIRFTSSEDGVDPLPVERDGETLLSTWELDDDERLLLATGATVELAVYGKITPPVSLAVTPPFCGACRARMVWSWDLRAWACAHKEDENADL